MKLERVLAHSLQNTIPGLVVYKDELGWNASPSYPYMLTSMIGKSRESMGTGLYDFKDHDSKTKIFQTHISIRFTCRCLAEENMSGNDSVEALVRQVDRALQELKMNGSVTLIDPESQIPIRISYLEYLSESDIQSLTDKLPVVYQKTLSYRFRAVEIFSQTESFIPIQKISQTL